MKVELLNPEVLDTLYKNWGMLSCECYATPKKYAEKIGKSCFASSHFSGSRTEYIKFEITADRGTLEQIMRHSVAVRFEPENTYDGFDYADYYQTRFNIPSEEMAHNMKSFRYCDMSDFEYTIPVNIQNNSIALEAYKQCMSQINEARDIIRHSLVENGVSERKAVEDSNFTLPRATETVLAIGFTVEALIHFMEKRLCSRAQDEIRAVAIEMKKKIAEVNPEFAKNLNPSCGNFLYCPEGDKSCGLAPTKSQVKELISKFGYQYKDPDTNKYVIKKE